MKIFSAAQIRACDQYTVHASGISSADLMERAATACTEQIIKDYPRDSIFIVLCGMGNNGGDGLVIARLLHQYGFAVKVFVLKHAGEFSADCYLNLQRFQQMAPDYINLLQPGAFITDVPANIILIDAILGTGLNRDAEGWLAEFINHINQLPNEKIAIDIPSGLNADNISNGEPSIIKAEKTLSFQFYKRSFLHPESGRYAGKIIILDIGLSKTFIDATHTNYHLLERHTVATLLRPDDEFAHKGSYGTAMIIGGSYGMMGAALLSTKAAARSGAGKVKAYIPECGYNIMQNGIPEALCEVNGEKLIQKIPVPENINGIGIGPGLGQEPVTGRAFASFLEHCKQPIVVDADALNFISKQPELLGKLPANSILTPHPKEFERIFGSTANTMMMVEQARFQSMRYNIYIILKGRYTTVVTPEGACYYNPTGNPGMATGGSGDVLTGILTSLMAQGYDAESAALIGVYVHGLAGDIALKNASREAMIAGDIIDNLGEAFTYLRKRWN